MKQKVAFVWKEKNLNNAFQTDFTVEKVMLLLLLLKH